jgi:hypothetical protein
MKTRTQNVWLSATVKLQAFGDKTQNDEIKRFISLTSSSNKHSELKRIFFLCMRCLVFLNYKYEDYCRVCVPELLTDDIAEAVACAKLIYRLQGFDAWHGWTHKCKNRLLPDVMHCLNETSTTDPPVYSVIMT